MLANEDIIQLIYSAVDELNQQLQEEQQLEKSVDTRLFGKSSKLDSLGLVNLIVATEEKIEEETGLAIAIADERALSQARSPFRTIGTLADYISQLLEENSDG